MATGDEIEIAAGVEWGNVLNEIKREEKTYRSWIVHLNILVLQGVRGWSLVSMLIIGVDADGCGDCLVCHYYTPHYYPAQWQSFLGHSGCTDVP